MFLLRVQAASDLLRVQHKIGSGAVALLHTFWHPEDRVQLAGVAPELSLMYTTPSM